MTLRKPSKRNLKTYVRLEECTYRVDTDIGSGGRLQWCQTTVTKYCWASGCATKIHTSESKGLERHLKVCRHLANRGHVGLETMLEDEED